MKQAEWTPEEFETLLRSGDLSAEIVTMRIPRRSSEAIEDVREGIHEFHVKGESSALSTMMKERLSHLEAPMVCPVCGKPIQARVKVA